MLNFDWWRRLQDVCSPSVGQPPRRKNKRRRECPRDFHRLTIESLENRLLLTSETAAMVPLQTAASVAGGEWTASGSSSIQAIAASADGATPSAVTNPYPGTIMPSSMRAAYGVNSLALTGYGETIAIVESQWLSDGNSGESQNTQYTNELTQELDAFDSGTGFSAAPTITGVVLPGASEAVPNGSNNIPLETALDIEWAHTMAPDANLLIVAGPIFTSTVSQSAIEYAASQDPAVVSISYGVTESVAVADGDEAADESIFSAYPNVAFFAASGDQDHGVNKEVAGVYYGQPFDYPGSSPQVVSVGGTEFTNQADPVGGQEQPWSRFNTRAEGSLPAPNYTGGGGGESGYFSQPSFQTGIAPGSTRDAPDISMDATDGLIYDSYDNAQSPWNWVWGTSLATPMFAGLVADADEGRQAVGLSQLGSGAVDSDLYGMASGDYYSSAFNDITSGNNDYYNAGQGYDLATGLGTPNAPVLVNALADDLDGPTVTTAGSFGTSTPTFSWNAVNGAVSYSYSITNQSGTAVTTGSTTGTSLQIPGGLLTNGNYSLSISSVNALDQAGPDATSATPFSVGATFDDAAPSLNLTLLDGQNVSIVSTGTTYDLTLSSGTWSGTDTANVAGNGSATLVVSSGGLASFTSAINITDPGSTGGDGVTFDNSEASGYFNNFNIALANASAASTLAFNGATNFENSASLSATVNGSVVINSGASLTSYTGSITLDATGTNAALTAGGEVISQSGAITLEATGDTTISPGITINAGSGPVTLAADVTASGAGDDGVGTLSINAGATVTTTGTITLRGADVNIDTSSNPGVVGATRQLGTTPSATYRPALFQPGDMVLDSSGNLYVANEMLNTVTEFAAGSTTVSATYSAKLSDPGALAIDASGNLYVANVGNDTVTKFAAGSTIVSATYSGLSDPHALAIDSGGNLYVANVDNSTVMKFAAGSTTVVATYSGLSDPGTLTFDSSGNLYVANYRNGTVTKFAAGSTTISATYSGLSKPQSLAFDSSGNLYVANYGNGTVTKFAAGSTAVSATYSGLSEPAALAFDPGGNLYALNGGNNSITEFAAGSTTASATYTAGLSQPDGLAIDSGGNLYVANELNSTITKFAAGSTRVSVTYSGDLSGPVALALDAVGDLYVANEDNNTVTEFAAGSTTASAIYSSGLSEPDALAFDSSGDLYVANYGNSTVTEFAAGSTTVSATYSGLDEPDALAFDSSGDLYVANNWNNTVVKFAVGSTTASATYSAGLSQPDALALDTSGNLYVANEFSTTVTKFAAGSTTVSATYSGLSDPDALAFDSSGNLYVANDNNGSDGTVTKFAAGSTTVSATYSTGFYEPDALAFDSSGDLFVADYRTVSEFPAGSTTASATYSAALLDPDALAIDSNGDLYVANIGYSTVSKLSPATTTSTAAGVVIQSSVESRPMLIGGTNSSPVAGINLTGAELAQIFTTSTGTVTIGDGQQTGNITFSTATPVTTAGAGLVVVQEAAGAGQVILDDGAGSGTALNGNGGSISITAGTGGITALAASDSTAEISTTGAAVTLLTAGPIGTSSNRIQFADDPNTAQQVVSIGSTTIQTASVYLDGLGSLTLDNIIGYGTSPTVDVKARTNLVVAAGGTINAGSGPIMLGADLTATETGDDGVGTLSINAGATVTTTGTITLRGADVNIDTSSNPAVVGANRSLGTTASTTLAGFNQPDALAFDSSGNLYVANYVGNTVSEFAPGATTPSATYSAGVDNPHSLAFDSSGNLYVANIHNTVEKFAPGSTAASTVYAAGVSEPYALAFDSSGNLYVANVDGNTVEKFAPGSTTAIATYSAGVSEPVALAVDSGGNLYVANFDKNTVEKFAPGSTTAIATYSVGLDRPFALALDSSGNLYVASTNVTNTVEKFAPGSTTPSAIYSAGVSAPYALAFDPGGNLYVANYGNSTVEKFAPGSTTASATYSAGVNDPLALAFDSSGNLYVANYSFSGSTVEKFSPASITPTASAVVIQSSVESRPMLIGGSNSSPVAGINLTSAELAQIFTTSAGTITIGDGQQTGNITLSTATPATTAGAAVHVLQSNIGAGQIILDEGPSGGVALNGDARAVMLSAGTGGIQATLASGGLPLFAGSFTASGSLNLALGFAPTPGMQITVIDITIAGNLIGGAFSNATQGGTVTADYQGTPYTFQINYDEGGSLVLTTLSSVSNQLLDPDFSAVNVGAGSWQYAPDGSPWIFTSTAGMSGNGGAIAGGNPNSPAGTQVAFVQGTGSISQAVILSAGTYTVDFLAAQRGNYNHGGQSLQVSIDGTPEGTLTPVGTSYALYATAAITLSAGPHTITITGLNPQGGDNTALVDAVSVQPTRANQVNDPDFIAVTVAAGKWQYAPSGSTWTFVGTAGVSGNGSAITAGNASAPQGSQVGFVQGTGSISEAVSVSADNFTLSFQAAQRGNYNQGGQTLQMLVDGAAVGGNITPTGTSYATFTTPSFALTAGTHIITIEGLDLAGGDNTALVDGVVLQPKVTQLADPDFGAVSVGAGNWEYAPSGSPWTFTGTAGVSGNGGAIAGGNAAAPQGSQVAFVQNTGSISQQASLASGSNTLEFLAAQRGNYNHGGQTLQMLVDGTAVGTITPAGSNYALYAITFTATPGMHTITIAGTDPQGGDNTALVNDVSLQTNLSTQLADPDFSAVSAGGWQYAPSGSPWIFIGTAGISGNATAITGGNTSAPEGTQVGFVQGTGSISQLMSVPNVAGITMQDTTRTLELVAAQRGNYNQGGQTLEVSVDGTAVGSITPTGPNYALYTVTFTATAGPHTITIAGTNPHGGDNTALVDDVSLQTIIFNRPADPDFAAVDVGAGNWQYGPSGSPWTFIGSAGVSGNGSAISSGNASAPGGTQVGFVQGTGALAQVLSLSAGSYTISFSAAQRGNYNHGGQTLQVLVDGTAVGSGITPTSSNYAGYTSISFTVSTGMHDITIQGLNPQGGDNTALIDQVMLNLA